MFPEDFYDAFYFTAGTQNISHDTYYESLDMQQREDWALQKTSSVLVNLTALGDGIVREAKTTKFNSKVHVGCQLHSLMWPFAERGV